MAELKHTITLDDSEFKKKYNDSLKQATQQAQKMGVETNKAINEENANRKKVIKSLNEQLQAQKALKLEVAKPVDPANAFKGTAVSPANIKQVQDIADAQKFYNSQIDKTVQAQKTQTVATKQTETATKAVGRSIQSLQIQLQSYQNIARTSLDPRIITQYNQKIQETQREINRLSNVGKAGFDSMGNAINKASGFTQTLRANFTALLGALGFTTLLFELVSLGKELFTIQKQAQGVELAFAKIGDPQALDRLRTAVKGTVSDLELMKVAVRADNFKIPMDVLGKGLEFARQRAQDTGQEVDYLVNSLVDGIGRKSTLVLDNLGISASELQAEFAKTGDFAEAVGNIIERSGVQGGIAIETLTQQTDSLSAQWSNFMRIASGFIHELWNGPQVDTSNISKIVEEQQKQLAGFEKWDEDRLKREIDRRQKHADELAKQHNELTRENVIAEFRAYRDSLTGLQEAGTVSDFLQKKKNALYEAHAAESAILKDLKTNYDALITSQRQAEGLWTPTELKNKIQELQGAFDNTFDPKQQQELNKEIAKYEAILDRITGKESKSGRNKSLEEREALLRKIEDIEAEYNRKSMSDDEAEIQAVRDKFANLADEIKKFNNDPDNKVKIDATILDPIREKAIADLRYKQDTEALKTELEIQKELYRDFERFRDEFGQEAARERYGSHLDLEKSFLSRLQDEIKELEGREGRSAVEQERLTMLQDAADKEYKIQRDKYDKILSGILSFNERRQVMEERHAREIAELGTNATTEQLQGLRMKHNEELSQLREDFRGEYTKELSGINSKEDLARGLAEISRFRIDKETELNRKLLNIAIKAARERIAVLEREQKELGVDNSDAIAAENAFIAKSENALDNLTKNYIHVGKALADILSQSSDDFVAKIGNMIGEVSNSLGQFQGGSSDLEKAQGFVGLFIAIGKTLKQTFIDIENQELETLKAMTQEVANRISFESKLNKLYSQRAKEANDNIFLGADFTKAASNAAEESEKALKVFDDAMQAIFEGGVFSAKGTGKRNLWGKKRGTYDFSFQDILSQLMGVNVDLDDSSELAQWLGKVLDPLSIFGQDAARRAEKDAFGNIQAAVSSALNAMGKSVEDFANFSGQEMLDFFTVMEEGGFITDSATKQLIQDGRAAAEVMKEAEAAIEGVISSLAGDLGNNLRNSLVEAFKAGEDAAEAFEKSVGQVLENIISQMIFDEIFRADFEELQKQMEGSLKGGDGDLTDDIVAFYRNAADNVPAFTDALETAREEAAKAGIDILGGGEPEKPQSPLVGAIKGITADQADLLAGQFAGMRLANLEMLELDKVRNASLLQYSELMNDQLASLNLIVFNTGSTATHTARLESIEVTLKSMNNKMNNSANALEASGIGG